jgi:hypothetical protein
LQKGILMKQYLVALTILLVAAVVSAAPSQRHREWCRAAVASLPVFHEDVDAPGKQAELDAIAEAVALRSLGAPLPPQTWAALILTVWKHESNLSSRIIAGNCKPKECDAGRARGRRPEPSQLAERRRLGRRQRQCCNPSQDDRRGAAARLLDLLALG